MIVARETEVEILHLCQTEHLSPHEAATQVGVHHDVVERVLAEHTEGPSERTPRPSILDPYRGLIAAKIEQYPRMHATVLTRMAAERGFTGGARMVQKYVSTLRPAAPKRAFLVQTHLPAEQAQCDWGHVGKMKVMGGTRALWVFVMWLAYSRYRFAELVFDLTTESLRRSLLRALVFFGGTSRRWVFDNPKTIALERHGREARVHPKLLDLAAGFCVQVNLARVRTPTDKGGVERAIRELKEGFFAGRVITSLEAGNAALHDYLRTVVARRAHPVFRDRTVADVFDDEREKLLPLPAAMPSGDLIVSAAVDATASVRLGTNRYSVPPAYAGRVLTLAADDARVRVLDGDVEVARHVRTFGKHQRIDDPRHREALLASRPHARALTVRDRLLTAIPELHALYVRWLETDRNLNFMTARVSQLFKLYGHETLTLAVRAMVARATDDPGALALLCEQERAKDGRPVRADLRLGDHVPDEIVVPHDLASYDRAPRPRRARGPEDT